MITDDPRAAATALLNGALVILPTETVYGLAARADDPEKSSRHADGVTAALKRTYYPAVPPRRR